MKKRKIVESFTCDSCGEEKYGNKHKVYDENWNLDHYECDDCNNSRICDEVDLNLE